MADKDSYAKLSEKLGARDSKRFRAILEEMLSAEECTVLMELFEPATCAEVAARLNMHEGKLKPMLESLVDRGVLTRGETQYAFHKTVLAFHHDVVGDPAVEPVPDRVKELWSDYFYNEWWQDFLQSYIDRKAKTGRNVHQVWPAITALELSPNIPPNEILPEEDFRVTIQNAKSRIMAPCGCRKLWGTCEHSIETCFACFDNARGDYYLNKPGRVLREVSMEEALEIARNCEKEGLVHIGVCYCCPDACEILYTLTKSGRFDLLEPSRFAAMVDTDACTGCQQCLDRCYFDAIEMKPVPGSKKMKASIVRENCKGCGICVPGCKQQALSLEVARPPAEKKPASSEPAPDYKRFSPWGFYDLK